MFGQVCNHPDLFEGRPIVSAFDMVGGLSAQLPSAAVRAAERTVWNAVDLAQLNLLPAAAHETMSSWEAQEVQVRNSQPPLTSSIFPFLSFLFFHRSVPLELDECLRPEVALALPWSYVSGSGRLCLDGSAASCYGGDCVFSARELLCLSVSYDAGDLRLAVSAGVGDAQAAD